MPIKEFLKLILLVTVSFGLLQCGETEDADTRAVSFVITPSSPIVIDADFTISYSVPNAEPITKEVDGPWYKVNFTFTNNSNNPVTIQTIKLVTTAISANGALTRSETALDPGDLPINLIGNAMQTYIEVIPPNGQATSSVNLQNWIVHGLPERDTMVAGQGGSNGTSMGFNSAGTSTPSTSSMLSSIRLSYRVEAEAIGWFGPPNNPIKGFRKRIFFSAAE